MDYEIAYACEAIIDTRRVEEQENRWGKTIIVPLAGTGTQKICDECGKVHEVHCYVREMKREKGARQWRPGRVLVVGKTCAKHLNANMAYADVTNTSAAHARKFATLTARYA